MAWLLQSLNCSVALSAAHVQVLTADLADRSAKLGKPWDTLCLDPGTVNTKMLFTGWGPCGIPVRSASHGSLLTSYMQHAAVQRQCYLSSFAVEVEVEIEI